MQEKTISNMIDFHTHVLNNIDDGPKLIEESLEMLKMQSNQGVTKVVCTSHFIPDELSVEEFLDRRNNAVSNLRSLLDNNINITLIPAAEVYCREELVLFSDLEKLCVEGTNLIMMEFPTVRKWPVYVWKVIENLINKNGLRVIIAHAERYTMLHKRSYKYLYKLIEMGCIIQVNNDSFTDRHYSKVVNKWLSKGLIHIIGSDCHSTSHRPPNIDTVKEYIIRNYGESVFEKLQNKASCILKKGAKNTQSDGDFVILDFNDCTD